jgi:very-short-patch-repair endonuclease
VRARALRQSQTDAEVLLWSKLRARQMQGLKFRRQHPLGNYFADFACIEIGLKIFQTAQTLTPTLSRKRERE